MAIWALSGFLGLPRDWDFLQWNHLTAVDWQMFSWESLTEWGTVFNQWVYQQTQTPQILLGYSLGGRLALHALIDRPHQWQAAIIISAHAGLTDPQEQQKRQQQDQHWAQRFESESWASLMHAWNSQGVFSQDSFHFNRQEIDYQRDKLSKSLIDGSLSRQADLRQQIASLPHPILWITGSQDTRYCQVAQSLTFSHPSSCWKEIEQAGHRVPWSQPQIFSKIVEAFLHQIQAIQ